MHRAILVLLLLAGCPDEPEPEPEETFDFFEGEGVTWEWGEATCVTYVRENRSSPARAWWMKYGTVVRKGLLSGDDRADDFRRGFYKDSGKLAIELGEGQGAYVKRFFYDGDKLVEVVRQHDAIEHTTYEYDQGGRIVASTTTRGDRIVAVERWEDGPDNAWASYSFANVAADGREVSVRGWSVKREKFSPVEVTRWSESDTRIYRYEHEGGRVVRAWPYRKGGTAPEMKITYTWDPQEYRILALEVTEAGYETTQGRIEVDYSGREVIEQRSLTLGGVVQQRTTYLRSENGDVERRIANGDGEPQYFADLRDECRRYTDVPELRMMFAPHLEVIGMVPLFRPAAPSAE